ncbi:unnamed protein product [Didymodactylos carnosus]|nr:unnamed protein product [Didymodactylos carnosus]CAF4424850.1 unnamed protein product [Didymodactylos carnosus]
MYRHLPWKIQAFRHMCKTNAAYDQLRIIVRHDHLYEDSFKQIMHCEPSQLRSFPLSQPIGETCLWDNDEAVRQWFITLTRGLFSSNMKLFTRPYSTQFAIDLSSRTLTDYLLMYRFVGRLLGMALYYGRFIYHELSCFFYNYLLDKKDCTADILHQDFRSGIAYLEKTNFDIDGGLDLKIWFYALDSHISDYLKFNPTGTTIILTEENKHIYIDSLKKWQLTRDVEEQAIADGFADVNKVCSYAFGSYFTLI